ncbi:hypothetical protein MRX96_051344 [Rhipicephalus microplus]
MASGQGDSSAATILKYFLFFAQLAVGLGVASLHHLTAVGNTDHRCATATLDGFTWDTFRRSWDDLVTSSLLCRNSPDHSSAYSASPIFLLIECYTSSSLVPTQVKCDSNRSDVTLTSPIAGFWSDTTPLPKLDKLITQLSHFFSGQGKSVAATMH